MTSICRITTMLSMEKVTVPYIVVFQRVEEEERAEEAAGARITKKKKTKGGKAGGGRQAKLTGGVSSGASNSLTETRPSPFAEIVDPVIPEFTLERKKPTGKGRGRVKAEPKDEESNDDPKQQKLTFKGDELKVKGGDEPAKKAQKKTATQTTKKRKVKELLDSFEISSSEEEGEEGELNLRERIEKRKTKSASYKEAVRSGDESVESEGSWKSGSDDSFDDTPPIKKAKVVAGGKKTAEAVSKDLKLVSKPKPAGKEKKVVIKPPVSSKAKASPKKVSSGEKKTQKTTQLGKKPRVVSHDVYSDDESIEEIDSASESDSIAVPAKKRPATEVSHQSPRAWQ